MIPTPIAILRKCCTCRVLLPFTAFYKVGNRKYGLDNSCKFCRRKRNARYFAENSEKVLKRQKNFYKENPENKRINNERYRDRNYLKIKDTEKKRKILENTKYDKKKKCGYCGSRKRLTIDHIIPLCFTNWYDIDIKIIAHKNNYETACHVCNSTKNAKIPLTDEHLERIESLLGYDIRDKILMKHCWIPPISRLKLF